MKRFAQLYEQLDQTTRTSEKVDALRQYFDQAPPEDAAWAMHVLLGRRIAKGMTTRRLVPWAVEEAGLPPWIIDECHGAVGDLGEVIALILDNAPAIAADVRGDDCDWPLHALIEQVIRPLRTMSDQQQRQAVTRVWHRCSTAQRFLFHKLISGAFRVGMAKKGVIQAAAQAAGVEPAIMEHRLMGRWEPTPEDYQRIMSAEDHPHDPGRPYPFYLAHQLDDTPDTLGNLADWQIEWKWDGIRAQLIRRNDQVLVWSRGEEMISEAFPELRSLGENLPDGTVLDGEVLAWDNRQPLPFGELQKRLNRKRVEPTLFPDVPVVYMAYDILESHGQDQRSRPLTRRRQLLESLCQQACEEDALVLSPLVQADSWEQVATLHTQSRDRGVEGFMLKRKDSPYGVGRQRGPWWKWKVDPHTADCVLIYAQLGNGRRANVFTDYTFGAWDDGELVPVAKAYSGLTDAEIDRVDRFVRAHTIQRRGPVRIVEPKLVFELAFEGIRRSQRHRSGIALRFPRMARWRTDKQPQDADTLDHFQTLLRQQERLSRR